MKRGEKKSVILYCDFGELFGLLSLEDKGRLITAIFNYENKGKGQRIFTFSVPFFNKHCVRGHKCYIKFGSDMLTVSA